MRRARTYYVVKHAHRGDLAEDSGRGAVQRMRRLCEAHWSNGTRVLLERQERHPKTGEVLMRQNVAL